MLSQPRPAELAGTVKQGKYVNTASSGEFQHMTPRNAEDRKLVAAASETPPCWAVLGL